VSLIFQPAVFSEALTSNKPWQCTDSPDVAPRHSETRDNPERIVMHREESALSSSGSQSTQTSAMTSRLPRVYQTAVLLWIRSGGGRIWWAHFEFTRISRWEKLGRGGAEMSK
jgi:hypothetical protein